MAGGFRFIWIPVLFTCAVCTSDIGNVLQRQGSSSTGNPDVDKILSKILIPSGIDASHINVTSVIIKTCEGMKETLAESQRQLLQMANHYNQLAKESFGLRSEARRLKVQLTTCMSTASSIAGTYQTHLQIKLNQMLEKLDPDTLLIFKIISLTREVSTLQNKIKLATNSNKTATEIRELRRQLEEKVTEQRDKIAAANESFSSGTLILQIISLQNQIWDLQEAKSGGEKAGSDDSIEVVKYQLTMKIAQLRDKGDTNFASLLELISVRSSIAGLKTTIGHLIEKSKTFAADARRQWSQKTDLLRKKILQLNEDESNKELTMEIMRLQAEVEYYAELMSNAKNITNSKIQDLRAILDQEKQRQDVIQRQLEATEYAKAQLIIQIISVMEELKEQHPTGQPITVLEAKEQEHTKALAKIIELQRKLRLLTEMGSEVVERYEQVKSDFDRKIAELNRNEEIQAALVLKLINLHDELKALKEQIALTEDQDLTSELQRQLEKRQEEVNSSIAHIERLTNSPGTILKIIELRYELWNLQNKAANGTGSDAEEELQDRLDGFINEINNRAGENTKLILKIVTLQSQLDHLKKRLEKNNSTSPKSLLIKDVLKDELTFKKTELQKYISELNAKNPSNAKLILATTDLYKNLKRIEKENHDDNAASSLTLSLLQIYLQNKNREYAIIKDKVTELERKLQSKTQECSGLVKHRDQLKKEVEEKIAELKKTKDAETALILNVIKLRGEIRALRSKFLTDIRLKDPEIYSALKRQEEERKDNLNAEVKEIERSIHNSEIILKITELQDLIWDLQNKDTNGTAANQIRELQNTMDRFISQIDQENTKLTLTIMNLQSQVKHLQNLLSNRETLQASKLSQLTNELAAKEAELEKHVNDLKEKNQENADLILDIIGLETQLENLEKVKTADKQETAAIISYLLQKLNETEDHCSDYEQTITDLQQNLTNKIKELKSKSDSVTSLALQISTLAQELEQLKRQLLNSVSRSKADELQKAIDEKNKELEELTKELKNRSTQPQRLLQIISLQRDIEKLVTVAQNDTDFDKITGLQDKLNYLIRGIQDEENENTKLTFQILNQQDEIARLRKQQEKKNQIQAAKIKDLEDELDIIRNRIKEKKALLDTSDRRAANLSAQILELEMKMEPLEEELSDLREAHNRSLAELQRRLRLKERQLEDTESQLQHADSEIFKHVMEIADLRAKLKQAETQTSKTSDKKIKQLEKQLKTQETETKKLEAANKELEKKLQSKTQECSGLVKQPDQLKKEVEQKISELKKTKDAETALILNVINLHAEQRALRERIEKAEDPEIISGLQRQLEELQDGLIAKIAEMEQLIANSRTILKIIEQQDEIWDLQNKDTNGTSGNQIRELQNTMDIFISQIDSRDQENTKLTLTIMNLQSQVKHLQNLLSNRETLQASKPSQLTNELAAKEAELEKHVNDLKEKNRENADLILDITDLQTKLENLEKVKTADKQETAAKISYLREQLKVKEEEHSRDQAVIQNLQRKLNETEDHCSDYEQTIIDLQQNLTNKIKSKSDSVTSLALQISTLTQEVEQLKRQLLNSVSRSKADELQKAIDEKNKELEELTKELKNRSTQPQRLLEIILLQRDIEKLVTVAQNDTDFDKIAGLQDKLNNLIRGIQDEENENTKLTFQILNQQDEIARLRKLEEKKNQTQAAKIKDLEDELDIIRNRIKEKKALLDTSDRRVANLSAQILELHMKMEPLTRELSDLREAHNRSLAELQRRLRLKERQLEDTESQLQHADSEIFKHVMEIADLRAKLKQAETQTSKTSDKKIKQLEKQLKTQETETKKLEAANKDLKQELAELNSCCNQVNDDCEDLRRDLQQSHEDVDRLQQQLNQKDARLNQLEQDLQRQTEKNNQLQGHFNDLQAERNGLEKKVEELQRELDGEEEKIIHTSKMTFDPDTAHPRIALSADKTELSTTRFLQNLPDSPERFDVILGVLGATGFSSGRHYWEVSVDGKTCYHLGMTSESSQRKGSPHFKPTHGYWTIVLDKQGQLKALQNTKPVSILFETLPVTLGVLLDYKKGTISFYDSGARRHLHSFAGQSFTDRIYPFVNFCVEDVEAPVVLINPGATDWIK